MADESNQERRVFTRIAIDCRAQLSCADRRWPTQLLDVSLKGALLHRPDDYQESDEPCTLELLLEPSDAVITMQGHIVHNHSGQLGFYCQHIDLDSIAHLKRMLELNMGDEAMLERELVELMAD